MAKQTQEEKRENELKMNWQTEEQAQQKTEEKKPTKAPATTGWGKIKLNM